MKEKNILLAICAVLCVISFMIIMVLSRSAKKPQSPQELVASAIDTMFTSQGLVPSMVQQPALPPAVQSQPTWKTLPSVPALAPTNAVKIQAGSALLSPDVWLPLDAKGTDLPSSPQTQNIRAYRGPVR